MLWLSLVGVIDRVWPSHSHITVYIYISTSWRRYVHIIRHVLLSLRVIRLKWALKITPGVVILRRVIHIYCSSAIWINGHEVPLQRALSLLLSTDSVPGHWLQNVGVLWHEVLILPSGIGFGCILVIGIWPLSYACHAFDGGCAFAIVNGGYQVIDLVRFLPFL